MKMSKKQEILSFRWKCFRGLKDTNWIHIKPLTIFIGPNNSGKTSLFYPLLILKQTIESMDMTLPLRTKGKYVNVGDFKNLIYNHDDNQKLNLEICFKPNLIKKKKKLDAIGKYPPGIICLIFQKGTGDEIELESLVIKDIYNRKMLERKLALDGTYSLDFFESDNQTEKGDVAYNNFLKEKPKHFLFDGRIIIESLINKGEKEGNKNDFTITGYFASLFKTLEYNSDGIKMLLKNIDYIGPLRQHPKRYYESIGEKPYSVGSSGEYTPDILLQMKKARKLNSINDWLKEFELLGKIDCREHQPGIFSIEWKNRYSKVKTNLADTGFGASQILPLITQGLWMSKERILIAEQPEIHLNPKLQGKLADFFVDIVGSGKKVILETHSEHLILRLRTLIAEKKIEASNIALYFIEKEEGDTSIKNIPITENGHVESEKWPKGFFEDSLKESFNLATIQSRR